MTPPLPDPAQEVRTAFQIGASSSSHVTVAVAGRVHPEATDPEDGNWLSACITIVAGAFRAAFGALLRAQELAAFRKQLRTAHERLVGPSVFAPIERPLRIEINGDGKGHFRATCKATDDPVVGHTLSFTVDFDQTDLARMLSEVDTICEAFPVIGASATGLDLGERHPLTDDAKSSTTRVDSVGLPRRVC